MIHLHQPPLAIIDLRGAMQTQIARTWATIEVIRGTRFFIVTTPGQLCDEEVPLEITSRVEIFELAAHENGFADLVKALLVRTDKSGSSASTLSSPQAEMKSPAEMRKASDQRGRVELTENNTEITMSSFSANEGHSPRHTNPSMPIVTANEVILSDGLPSATAPKASVSATPMQECNMADRFRTRTPELRAMLRRLEVAARHNVTMLLIGETGAGKTHLAKLIHDVSPRANEPFLHLACGALPGELIESELFGHVKGAFTSAHADKDGKFLVAGNGTILLDEIDVLTPDQQVKLLRVIEKGEFEPVGSNRTLHVKARIIAASNLQLQPLVEQGKFRPDLYYRLNTLSFSLPPLRKRLPDIEPLAKFFVHQHASAMGIDIVEITTEFMECLLRYPWPGNVREMENAIRSAVIYSEGGRMTPSTLPQHVVECMAGPGNDPSVAGFFAVRQGDSLGNRIELTEKDIIEQALLNNNFSRTNTAKHLGISRVTLYNKMRKYGILPER